MGQARALLQKNRIPEPFPPTFPHCGFAAPCRCDEAGRQDHGQAPRDGHLLSERRRMGLDLFIVRTTRSRKGVLEQGQRPPSRAYRTRESGRQVRVDGPPTRAGCAVRHDTSSTEPKEAGPTAVLVTAWSPIGRTTLIADATPSRSPHPRHGFEHHEHHDPEASGTDRSSTAGRVVG